MSAETQKELWNEIVNLKIVYFKISPNFSANSGIVPKNLIKELLLLSWVQFREKGIKIGKASLIVQCKGLFVTYSLRWC